jgi:hypothetical protein
VQNSVVFSLSFTSEFLGWAGAVMTAQESSNGIGSLAAILSQNDMQRMSLLLLQLPLQAQYEGGSEHSL